MRLLRAIARHLCMAALAGALLALVSVTGCASAPAPTPRVGYVRLESLVALHPGYRSIADLNLWAQDLRRAARQSAPALPAPAPHGFAPMRGGELAQPQAQEAPGRVERVIDRQLARVAQEMEARTRELLARRARDAAREAEAQDAERSLQLAREFDGERRQVLLEHRRQVFNLQLNAANLRRLLEDAESSPAERARAQERLQAAQEELRQALEHQSQQLAALERRYEERLAALRQAAAEQAAHQVADLRQSLERERERELAAERERLRAPLAAAEQRLTLELELPGAQAATAEPGAMGRDFATASAALRMASSRSSAELVGEAGNIAAARRELLDLIRQDTRAAAEALARAHNWRIEWAAPRGPREPGRDITARAEKWLRAHWGSGAEPALSLPKGLHPAIWFAD